MADLFAGFTPEQAEDAARFLVFMDEWPQDAADADPDEWARAEQLAAWFREHPDPTVGHALDVPVEFLVRVLRACELFDAVASMADPEPPELKKGTVT